MGAVGSKCVTTVIAGVHTRDDCADRVAAKVGVVGAAGAGVQKG